MAKVTTIVTPETLSAWHRKSESIELPEQIRIQLKTPLGSVRQLASLSALTDSPLTPFTAGNVAGRLYTRPSGKRVFIVDKKVSPPDFVDEVLEIRPDQPSRWLKPVPISDITQIPGGEISAAEGALASWKDQFFYIEEHTSGQTTVPGLHRLLVRDAARRRDKGVSRFELGDAAALIGLKNRCRLLRPRMSVFVVQPGLSRAKVTSNQLELLATSEMHVKDTCEARLRVIASA